jgi:hypothetical protein
MTNVRKDSRRRSHSCAVEEVFLQPWFLDHKAATAVRRIVPDRFVKKMRFYFEDWGCLVCESKRRRYGSNGMCHLCIVRTRKRLFGSLQKRGIKHRVEPTKLMEEVQRVRSARMLLSDLVSGGWSPNRLRLRSSAKLG